MCVNLSQGIFSLLSSFSQSLLRFALRVFVTPGVASSVTSGVAFWRCLWRCLRRCLWRCLWRCPLSCLWRCVLRCLQGCLRCCLYRCLWRCLDRCLALRFKLPPGLLAALPLVWLCFCWRCTHILLVCVSVYTHTGCQRAMTTTATAIVPRSGR